MIVNVMLDVVFTALASEFAGGVSFGIGDAGRLRVNVEGGDLMVRYALETLRSGGKATDGFIGHSPLVSVGVGWRF